MRRCNPHPSRGRQLQKVVVVAVLNAGCNPHPSRGRQLKNSTASIILPRCNPQTPSHLPIHSRFASANRGASSKAARFFRHRRRFASFPLRGRQQIIIISIILMCPDAIRRHRRTCRFTAASRLPIGVLPRKRLAFPATGGASPLSPSGVNTEAVFSASVYFCAKAFLRCPRSPVAQDLSAPPGLYLDPQHLFPAVMDKGKLRFTSPVRQNIHLPCGFPAGDRPQNGAPVSYMQQAA